ncbi:hypothetical protein RJ640_007482 [Escallonia rubra]|uniref:Palmitoyl-protein thioesterase 1 n=1 Tax=Escallonia rubra TaxID=112253 RepID=A0AA88RLC4_9ASTE|nr:hypothetical protein RJ640_007482 [Escallonia rubra]
MVSLIFGVFVAGISDKCSSKGVTRFTELLSNWSGAQGYCIILVLHLQTTIACEKVFGLFFSVSTFFNSQVKKISELSEGYNIVGLSQGTLYKKFPLANVDSLRDLKAIPCLSSAEIALHSVISYGGLHLSYDEGSLVGRGVVEFCDGGPPVKNFISLAGPHAGEASIPFCGSTLLCILVDELVKLEVYSNYVQEHLAPAGYIKIPTDIKAYLKGCRFLPKLNNELVNHKNSTYKERFASLQNVVLIMFEQDTVLIPKETSWFGYYPDGSWSTVLPPKETKLYTEDWIGLKTLDEAGKVKFVNVSGNHLDISLDDVETYIVPYLEDDTSTHQTLMESSHMQPSSVRNFQKLVGLTGERLRLHTSN